MLFSIIVPVHNGQKYIKSSVESVINQQTDLEYEIIIVENGSTDETPSIVDHLAADCERITAVHLGAIGLYSARQEGIKRAKGEYIIALDSDDEADPSMIESLNEVVCRLEGMGKQADVIFYNVADMDHKDKQLFTHPFTAGKLYEGAEKQVFRELIVRGDSINSMWSKCIRRDIAYLGQEDKYLNYGEDLYQTVQYLDRANSIIFLDKILYYYRQNDSSITSSYSEVFMENQKLVWKMVDDTVSNWTVQDSMELISQRKALTCAIAVARISDSLMKVRDKKKKLKILMADEFYVTFHNRSLPDWAPEEDVFYHRLMCADNPYRALVRNAYYHNMKTVVKSCLKR